MTATCLEEKLIDLEWQIAALSANNNKDVAFHLHRLIAAADLRPLPSEYILGDDLQFNCDNQVINTFPP